MAIGVPAKQIWGSNEVLPKFCEICPNRDILVLYVYDKKIVWDSKMKTKKKSLLWISLIFLNFCSKIMVFSKKKVFT